MAKNVTKQFMPKKNKPVPLGMIGNEPLVLPNYSGVKRSLNEGPQDFNVLKGTIADFSSTDISTTDLTVSNEIMSWDIQSISGTINTLASTTGTITTLNSTTGTIGTINTSAGISLTEDDIGLNAEPLTNNNISLRLGDNSGGGKVKIRDSVGTTMCSFDSDGNILAVSYGGILEANLLDKSTTETITGDWTFNDLNLGGTFDCNDNSITDIDRLEFTDTAGLIAGIQNGNLVDKSAAESITGIWTFNDVTNFDDGTEASPSIRFRDDTDTGIYRVGTNNLGLVTNATERLNISTTDFKIKGCSLNTADVIAFATGDTTPTVRSGNTFSHNYLRSATITDFDDASDSQTITILALNSSTTIADNANIHLNGTTNFAMATGDTLTLKYINSIWREVGRMVR